MTAEQMSNMSNTEKKLDVICLGAAVVDIPLRPVSRDIFDIESYPVDRIAMSVGGDAMNEALSLVSVMTLQVSLSFAPARRTT